MVKRGVALGLSLDICQPHASPSCLAPSGVLDALRVPPSLCGPAACTGGPITLLISFSAIVPRFFRWCLTRRATRLQQHRPIFLSVLQRRKFPWPNDVRQARASGYSNNERASQPLAYGPPTAAPGARAPTTHRGPGKACGFLVTSPRRRCKRPPRQGHRVLSQKWLRANSVWVCMGEGR